MYFPTGWPRVLNMSISSDFIVVNHICCDAVKILVAAISDDILCIWYANPLTPITSQKRSKNSVFSYGANETIVWKPDSKKIAILSKTGVIIVYEIDFESNESGILMQIDSSVERLKRESADLFIKEDIPSFRLRETNIYKLDAKITSLICITLNELLIATDQCELIPLLWTNLQSSNSCSITNESINLRKIPFYVNQNCSLKTFPTIHNNAYLINVEYSPFIGGCAVVFNNNRAAFLNVAQLRFEMQNIQGFWVPDIEDATVCSINHKFRLLAFGRRNSDVVVFAIEDKTGGLEFSHRISLSSHIESGSLGHVNDMRWSPDGCVLAVTWQNGGISLWSTFGALLMSTFNWDFGLNVDLFKSNPLAVNRLEWSREGYQLFLTCKLEEYTTTTNVLQINFVKSVLTVNPCMASQPHILLQGDDCLYLSQGYNLEKIYFGSKLSFPNHGIYYRKKIPNRTQIESENIEIKNPINILSENKHWNIIQLPVTYAATNWPIRYSAIDKNGYHLAVAGRTGLAHYSLITRKWKVFGNETQEKDFVVTGGLMYWKEFLILGCYSLIDQTDEIRSYPEDKKLDNQFRNKILVRAPVISLNIFENQLIVLTADGVMSLFLLIKIKSHILQLSFAYEIDVKHICIHPACIVSLNVFNLRMSSNQIAHDSSTDETIIVNVSGRILMMQRDRQNKVRNLMMASCLASSVELFWMSSNIENSPMHESLWFYSGANGMRVWLPILPPMSMEKVENSSQHLHAFISKRIMLSFPLKLYPLVILFNNVIALGVENETNLFCNELKSHFALPFCMLTQKSEVYLHRILRQLIKRNLGYSAWEIAKSCSSLPYFPHSLELLLHEVLEEEATSKEPIPDAQLPSVLNFAKEFPVYLKTVIQCARKTEIALWPYLFSVAGKPKDLFKQCLQSEELNIAASFLIILQNLEPSLISKQYATLLLDIAIKNLNWKLARDLIRFLKAIDPNEIESPRSSMIVNVKIAPPNQGKSQLSPNAEAFNMLLGPITRERSFSTTLMPHTPKDRKDKTTAIKTIASLDSTTIMLSSAPSSSLQISSRRKCTGFNSTIDQKESFCIDRILQTHARSFLNDYKLIELGYMSAFLDFHLVSWLTQESDRSAKLNNFVIALRNLYKELNIDAVADFYTNDVILSSPKSFKYDEILLERSNTQSLTAESGYASLAQRTNAVHEDITVIKKPEIIRDCPLYGRGENYCDQSFDRITTFSNDSVKSLPFVFGLESCPTIVMNSKCLPEKLAIKIRYLLQLFIEANCIDYALVLSILLKDAASIGRIINGIIRSESLTVCNRINVALKHLMHWSLENECSFDSTFMISLRPYMNLLEKHLSSAQRGLHESISNQMSSDAFESTIDNQLSCSRKLSISNTSPADTSWNFERVERQGSFPRSYSYGNNKALNSLPQNVKHKQQEESGSCTVM